MPFDFWPDREPGPVFNIFYGRNLNDLIRVGSFFEFEKVKFSYINSPEISSGSCFNVCLNWLALYPKTPLHAQAGGYVGYGFMNGEGWDNLKGPMYGIILGPAYELDKIGIAVHVQVGRAWYESTGTPLGVMTYTPKFLLKVYYKLADF